MRRVGRYSRIVVRILIVVTVGILFMLGRYVLQRLSGRLQTTSFDTIASHPVEEVPSIAIERDSNETEVAEFISASEEPINETVSPVMADRSTSEEAEESADTSPSQPEAYCVKCRARRGMKDARRIVTKNNRNAMEGVCPVCGTRLFRFISTSN
ncbi:DUF5679 domain-containing protein [Dictyobacter halimunensis]|uniref:DUF5679 domain-containing protein n=1 Tax=Dictyobacter halimunensis TaxID=3026934 RepID=UPI0030C6782E